MRTHSARSLARTQRLARAFTLIQGRRSSPSHHLQACTHTHTRAHTQTSRHFTCTRVEVEAEAHKLKQKNETSLFFFPSEKKKFCERKKNHVGPRFLDLQYSNLCSSRKTRKGIIFQGFALKMDWKFKSGETVTFFAKGPLGPLHPFTQQETDAQNGEEHVKHLSKEKQHQFINSVCTHNKAQQQWHPRSKSVYDQFATPLRVSGFLTAVRHAIAVGHLPVHAVRRVFLAMLAYSPDTPAGSLPRRSEKTSSLAASSFKQFRIQTGCVLEHHGGVYTVWELLLAT